MPTVFLVDDDPSARQGLARLLRAARYEVMAFASAREFLDAGPPRGPGCLVLDVRMPEISGLDLQDRLAREKVAMPIIFITGHGDIPMSVQAMKNGAVDFLPKPVDATQLLSAVQQALEMDQVVRKQREEQQSSQNRLGQLSAREHEVMQRVIRGALNKQIAAELGIAEPTVKIHRGRAMAKLGVASVPELIMLFQKAGQLMPDGSGPSFSPPGSRSNRT